MSLTKRREELGRLLDERHRLRFEILSHVCRLNHKALPGRLSSKKAKAGPSSKFLAQLALGVEVLPGSLLRKSERLEMLDLKILATRSSLKS